MTNHRQHPYPIRDGRRQLHGFRRASLGLLAATLALIPTAGDAQPTEIIDATGDGTNALRLPTNVATDGAGNAFVSGATSNNVFKITPGGVITEIIDSTGDGTNPLLEARVTADAVGNAYAIGRTSNNGFKITPGGTITQIIDSTGDGTNALDAARAVATDAAGNVFVAGEVSDNAFKITPGGTITQIIDSTGDGTNSLDGPRGITTDSSGNVYVTGTFSDNVFKITPGGAITEIIDGTGDGTNPLDLPQEAATDAYGNVYVTGTITDNAFEITPGGTITQIIDSTGDGTNALSAPLGVVVDSTGNVYIAGQRSADVFKIEPGGTITQVIDSTGDGTNPLNGPGQVMATDPSGNLFVTGAYSDNAFKVAPPIVSQTVRGKSLAVRDSSLGADPTKRRIHVRAKENASTSTLVGDPTTGGATLAIIANGANPTSQAFTLPAEYWQESISVPGQRFQYRDPRGDNGPVSRAHILRSASGKVTIGARIDGKNNATVGLDVVPPNDGTDAFMVLEIGGGDRYCVMFGADGEVSNRGARSFRVRNPTAEGCPP